MTIVVLWCQGINLSGPLRSLNKDLPFISRVCEGI